MKNFSYNEAENIIKTNNKQYQYLFELWEFMSTYNKQITDISNHKIFG